MTVETVLLITVTVSQLINTTYAWKQARETKEVTTDKDIDSFKMEFKRSLVDLGRAEQSIRELQKWQDVEGTGIKKDATNLAIEVGRNNRRIIDLEHANKCCHHCPKD